jgi:hypothetical protein
MHAPKHAGVDHQGFHMLLSSLGVYMLLPEMQSFPAGTASKTTLSGQCEATIHHNATAW